MSQHDEEATYQTCIWYGIHYPYEMSEQVAEALSHGDPAHKSLATEREYVGEDPATETYYRNSNSDFEPTHGCLLPNHMALYGEEYDDPMECSLQLIPSELTDLEDANPATLEFIDKTWQLLRKHLTPDQIEQMNVGWEVYIREHGECDDSSCSH